MLKKEGFWFNLMRLSLGSIFLFTIFSSLSISSFAAVIESGNITLRDFNINSTSSFNFTSNKTGLGHLKYDNSSNQFDFIETMGGAQLMALGSYSKGYSDFVNNFNQVPLANFTSGFQGARYVDGQLYHLLTGYAVALLIPNGTGGYYYSAIYITQVNFSNNMSFYYKFNNQSGNNSFGGITECAVNLDFQSCINDVTNSCNWNDQRGICEKFSGFVSSLPPADCGMMPKFACDGINDTYCKWNANAGKYGKCESQQNYNPLYGFNCSAVINQTVCNDQQFTEKSGLCTWDNINALCNVNKTKTFANLPNPPYFSCQAAAVVSNQTLCQNLSDTYFMPCGWNNQTNRCEELFFDFGSFNDFGDIGSENTCQLMGGSWKSETTFDPISNGVSSESWCEIGFAIKTFDAIGGGGHGFSGHAGQLNDCSRDCFACEFNTTGGRWPDTSTAKSKCESSVAGCQFRQDSNAFNGYGWCNPAGGLGGFNCDTSCGDCMLMPEPNASCIQSSAGCKWDNITRFCVGSGQKGCNQECMQCFEQTSCQNSPASGGCQWDSTSFLCKPKGGNFEICFDAVDNDNNGKTDCADFKCATDSFCAGSVGDVNDCFKYVEFSYPGIHLGSGQKYAQRNCTSATGCYWVTEGFGFGYCAPASEQCFKNESFSLNRANCEGFTVSGSNVCVFEEEGRCYENATMVNSCLGKSQIDCGNMKGCAWNNEDLRCDIKAIVTCEDNETLQVSQTLCEQSGCFWQGDQFGGGFEGGFHENCLSPCLNTSITTADGCASATNKTGFINGSCVWQTGFCEPKDFIGGCVQNDGDYSTCKANTNCNWAEFPYAPLRHPNGSTNFNDYLHPADTTWLAIGLELPLGLNAKNESVYNLTRLPDNTYVALVMQNGSNTENLSRIYCNATIIMEYNWSEASKNDCIRGACNAYNKSSCGNNTVHYYLSNITKQLEVLWEVPIYFLSLDSKEADNKTTDVTNISTVTVNGNLSEQVRENATAGDGTNATRVRTSAGLCDGKLSNNFFAGMDQEPPMLIAGDVIGDLSSTNADTPSSHSYLDLMGLGVKKTPEAYAYGLPVVNISGSALCNKVPLLGGSFGGGTNTSRYYLYLDTDGKSTGSCSADDNSALVGFEYKFKYVAQIGSDGKLSETLVSQSCSLGSWIPTNVPFKSDKVKACSFVNGPMFAIDKDTLTGKSDVNTSKSWRAYAVSAHVAGNSSNVSDKVGPGSADFKGIDIQLVDCTSTTDKDNPQCNKFKQFGFFPGEFGPACLDNIDNDGDSLTDCNDFDCKYDPFFCSGSFASVTGDDSAPSLVWTKVNQKIPTALTFIFGTDEPANGTVRFYDNDSACSALNITSRDKALDDGDSHTNYRPHHVADVSGLAANKTYFYKYEVCDPTSNCAVSECSNATTSFTYENVTFKLEVPANWTVDIPSLNLTNYSAQYALKASTEYLDNTNITVRNPDNKSAITFIGVDIFEKQTLNISKFATPTGAVGIDANQYQSFKQKTGMDKALVKIPSTGSIAQHCDDNGANCKTVTSKLTCTFGSSFTECQVPDGVGLGFSTYKATSSSTSSTSTSGGGGGGGDGGGGGPATSSKEGISKSQFWQSISANQDVSMKVDKTEIPITQLSFTSKKTASNAEIKITALTEAPSTDVTVTTPVYKYISIDKKVLSDENIDEAELEFKVERSWLNANSVSEDDIALMRYTTKWDELETIKQNSDANYAYYKAFTPGFSYFAIVSKVSKPLEEKGLEAVSEEVVEEGKAEELPTGEATAEIQEVVGDKKKPNKTLLILSIVAMLLVVASVIVTVYKKRQQ